VTKIAPTRADLPPALQRALDLAVDAKAAAPAVLQLTEIAGYTDWALIVSGRSDRHVGGITDAILAGLKDMGLTPTGTDGLEEHLWDLLDYEDFLVHVFYHPVRKHYDLESMWRDAPRAELALPAEVMDTSALEGLTPPVDMPPFRGSFGAFPGELDEEAAGAPGELALDDDEDDEAYAHADDEDVADDEVDEAGEFADDDYDYGGDDDDDDEVDELAAEPAPAPPAAQRRK
jgi:ribosome-associated protein